MRAYGTKCIALVGLRHFVTLELVGMNESDATRAEFATFCRSNRLAYNPEHRCWFFPVARHLRNDAYSDADRQRVEAVVSAARNAGFDVEQF